MKNIVEICCGSYYDAKQAYLGGAKRIELNSALHLGGLTPSTAAVKLTKKDFDLKVIAMLRPRGAGFNYNDEDFKIMIEDCNILLENGADGIAFGFLKEDSSIDIEKTKIITDIIKKYNKEAVFHRAIDCVESPFESIESLIKIGIDRILTSGLKNKAIDGLELIKSYQEKFGDKIEILAGSGINAENAKNIIDFTNIYQVHSSCKEWINDTTTSNENVSYAYAEKIYENCYDVVSKNLVEKLIKSVE